MNQIVRPLILFFVILFIFSGCIPQKETVLLQDISQREKQYTNPYQSLTSITDNYYLLPNDYIFINISTADPKISEFFNANSAGGNMGGNQGNYRFFYYQIDDSMNIDFPFTGKINLSGCNITKAKQQIIKALKPYLKEANIVVKLANNQFTVLGEVGSKGVKTMKKDQVTIFDAIAEAGGITTYGKRKQVKVIRQTPQGAKTYIVDVTDQNIVNSDVYYIYPNDLIYVRPMKAKNWGIGESFSIGIISSLLALSLTIISLTK